MQAGGQIPADGSDIETTTYFQRERALAHQIWHLLLEPVAQKSGCSPKVAQGVVQHIVHELAQLLTHPEWPGAELLLHSLVRHLTNIDMLLAGKAQGKLVFAKEDREHVLELLGTTVAQVRHCCSYPICKRLLCVSVLVQHCTSGNSLTCGCCTAKHT